MILADEVGLGKTIEAALIVKELRARGIAERVLILTPASLTLQWKSELSLKFNEDFEVFDGYATKHYGRGDKNPWLECDRVIASLPFALGKKQFDSVVEAGWDLVVVDEAHKVRRTQAGNSVKVTEAYRLVDSLKDQAHGLLLLTATPMQLHLFELYSMIELVEPGLFPTLYDYEEVSQRLPKLNDLMRELIKWPQMTVTQREDLLETNSRLLQELDLELPDVNEAEINDFLDTFSTKHPLSEVMIRNRKRELDVVSKRIAHQFIVDQSPEEEEVYLKVEEYLRYGHNLARDAKRNAIGFLMANYYRMLTSSSHSLQTSMRKRADNLRSQVTDKQGKFTKTSASIEYLMDPREASELDDLVVDAAGDIAQINFEIDWLDRLANELGGIRDSKAQGLLDIMREIEAGEPGAKVLIFTQFTTTQEFLRTWLADINGFNVAIFNGQLKSDQKEAEIRKFKDKAQILISTEAGGEGRNLQFAHYLVNYDLPWNPMKVEQRIGRLDRIGQQHPVVIYNLAYRGTIEERILELLENRIRLFESSVGSLDSILGEIESEIRSVVFMNVQEARQKFDALSEDVEKKVLNAMAAESVSSDFMMDRASLRRDYVNQVLDKGAMADFHTLREMMKQTIAHFGGTLMEHPDGGDEITLTSELAAQLKTTNRTLHGTFDPAVAATREDLQFFAFGNKHIDTLIAAGSKMAPTGIPSRFTSDLPDGIYLEVVYRMSIGGLRPESTLVRHIVSPNGDVQATFSTRIDLSQSATSESEVPEWVAEALAESERKFDESALIYREDRLKDFENIRSEEHYRAQRVFTQMRIRTTENLQREQEWLAENMYSKSEKIQKIIPARKGRVTKLKKKLDEIDQESEIRRHEIQSQEPEIEFEKLWISLVRSKK